MTKLEVINSALMKAGLPLAASLTDCDWNAAYIYDNCRREVLRSHPWSFARSMATLVQDEPPPFGYSHSYFLPADLEQIVDIRPSMDLRGPQSLDWERTGDKLLCDISPCNIRYTKNHDDPATWPPAFADAVASLIAHRIASLSAEKSGLAAQLLQLYQLALSMAIAQDGKERRSRLPETGVFERKG